MPNPENPGSKDLGPISQDEIAAFIRHINSVISPLETSGDAWRQEIINEAKAWFSDHPDMPPFDGFEKAEE
jgi:hypothetical protein